MDKESAVICIDNSEWMRNGDLVPTRLQCQQEAVNLVLQCKLRANPENGVGLLSMADQVEVLSTMTREDRKLFIKLHEVIIKGTVQLVNAIKVAHLALRHRQNRHHKMRIVVFVGSPIPDIDKAEFIKLAKKLKKEKVNVNFICFGEATSEDNQVLADFVDTLNGKDSTTSSILVVSSGSKLIEALITSPICRGEDGASMAMVGNGGGFEFGIDPEEDPELALALRVSLEEQRQRQRQQEGNEEEPAQNNNEAAAAAVPMEQEGSAPAAPAPQAMDPAGMTEEEQLQWALRMSMAESAEPVNANEGGSSSAGNAKDESMEVDESVGQLMDDPELLQQIVNNMSNEDAKSNDSKEEKPPAKGDPSTKK